MLEEKLDGPVSGFAGGAVTGGGGVLVQAPRGAE
jgi:hypothetical protein